MSVETRSHLTTQSQRRFKWIIISVTAVLILILAPLVVSGELRLKVAHRLDLVPGGDVEQVASADDGKTLIVLPIETTDEDGRPEYRFRAAVIARETPGGVELAFIDSGATVTLTLDSYDFYSGSYDGRHLLIHDTTDPAQTRGVLVDLDTESFSELPVDDLYPTAIEGNWKRGAWEITPGLCGGYSPHLKYISCYQRPKLATYLAGDWELQVVRYGDATQRARLYRGIGFRPWVGWSSDDSRLYFQNEHGLWVVPVSDDLFS